MARIKQESPFKIGDSVFVTTLRNSAAGPFQYVTGPYLVEKVSARPKLLFLYGGSAWEWDGSSTTPYSNTHLVAATPELAAVAKRLRCGSVLHRLLTVCMEATKDIPPEDMTEERMVELAKILRENFKIPEKKKAPESSV